jgi:hypothetical protein
MKNGLENPGVLDAFAHDTREDRIVLAMYESRPWEGDEMQLFQLQEKLNAYLSFVLDGEMTEAFPHLAGKPTEIQLRTRFEPDPSAWDLIRRITEQLSFQDIKFDVILTDEDFESQDSGGGCCGGGGSSCGCH